MVNYQDSKIYKLVCNVTGLVYVGSTTQPLDKRKYQHEAVYKRWRKGHKPFLTSFDILENSDFEIVLIEPYPCTNKKELHRRERYWIDSMECVNQIFPVREVRTDLSDEQQERKKLHDKRRETLHEKLRKYRMRETDFVK